jgi:hypothetical protein
MNDAAPSALKARIDAIEEAYEFMLAYAAQGHLTEANAPESVRDYLVRAEKALDGMEKAAAAAVADAGWSGDAMWSDFVAVLGADAARARTVLRFAIAQRSIGSQLVDNINASIHVRTLLTDLFVLDEALDALGR